MHVVHETIYQSLYGQGRGELRRELTRALRTGRAIGRPHRHSAARRVRFVHPMVMISERPAEAADRAVPGHGEGDLIVGKNNGSAIGTVVERSPTASTRYLMLVHLPRDHGAAAVRNALTETVQTLPPRLMPSLTWDQGIEMTSHRAFTITTDIPVHFCDPASPWQCGSNGNTNGRLRQYFRLVLGAAVSSGTAGTTSMLLLPSSTAAHPEKRSTGRPRPSVCLNCSRLDQLTAVLLRPLEFAHAGGASLLWSARTCPYVRRTGGAPSLWKPARTGRPGAQMRRQGGCGR
ncbi:hypothetical protein GCM10010358_75560 [Streptomyces minutiscleroticus]|uniref:Transposase n=1 Tax=Streptomyces minutiscleroticus TaxID=68238 RepID=A0A918P1D9_9ACTN|nr:hypothetical protein GCM10010358_75560 [Streptomyces minutiscleroticus]